MPEIRPSGSTAIPLDLRWPICYAIPMAGPVEARPATPRMATGGGHVRQDGKANCLSVQVVIPTPFSNNSALTQYARTSVEALCGEGVDAVLLDTDQLPELRAAADVAELLHRRLRAMRPAGKLQVYCHLVPDMRFGNTSIAGHLARRSLEDPGLRVTAYIHEFTEGVRRYGEARMLALQHQMFPVGRMAVLATTTEFEAWHLSRYLTVSGGWSLMPLVVPRLRHTRVVPMPPILPPTTAAQTVSRQKFSEVSVPRLVVLGGFRPTKGIDPDSGLGLYHLLDALAARVRRGRIAQTLEVHVAGRLSDTSRVEHIPGGRHGPALRCLEALFALDDRARALLRAYLMRPGDAELARELERHLEQRCRRYPFVIRLHLDREDRWLSEHVLAPAHLGLLFSSRGVSCRNTVLFNFAAHRIPIMANDGEECPGGLRPHLLRAYDERDRDAAKARGELESFLARSMGNAAEECLGRLGRAEDLAALADGAWEALGRPSAREHARQLAAWFQQVADDRPTRIDAFRVRLLWPLGLSWSERSSRELLQDPCPRANALQALLDAACRLRLLRAPLSAPCAQRTGE